MGTLFKPCCTNCHFKLALTFKASSKEVPLRVPLYLSNYWLRIGVLIIEQTKRFAEQDKFIFNQKV